MTKIWCVFVLTWLAPHPLGLDDERRPVGYSGPIELRTLRSMRMSDEMHR